MAKFSMISLLCMVGLFVGSEMHPGRPAIPDDPKARAIFIIAQAHTSHDGFLSPEEMSDIFSRFDMNGDGDVDETEFIAHWTLMQLGDLDRAVTLFHRADTDKDGQITKDPDSSRIFVYFDRDSDSKISEAEFVQVWHNLSS